MKKEGELKQFSNLKYMWGRVKIDTVNNYSYKNVLKGGFQRL